MKALQTYFQCWLKIAKQERYQDKWLSDETIFRAIKAQFPSLEALGFNRGIMNKAISSYEGYPLRKERNFGVVGYFSASEGFRQQLCQFFPNRSSKHVKLTVISSPIDLELGITKNDRIYREIL
jgi:hypothetical protein